MTTPIAPTLPQRPDAPRPMFSSLAIASSGLSAQRFRMDVIAENLANVETTRTPQGGPYHRRIVNLEAIEPQATATVATVATPALPSSTTGQGIASTAPLMNLSNSLAGSTPIEMADNTGGVRVASVGEDSTDGPMVYDPGHPDADKNGYVHMPNVRMTDEMMDLMNARRLYEANATVFQVARAMLHKAIDI